MIAKVTQLLLFEACFIIQICIKDHYNYNINGEMNGN